MGVDVQAMKIVPLYREMHEQGQFMSNALAPWVGDIARLVKKSGAKTLLDYGSGGGHQYHIEKLHEAWGVMPALYDPAVQGIDVKPEGQFDGVISQMCSNTYRKMNWMR